MDLTLALSYQDYVLYVIKSANLKLKPFDFIGGKNARRVQERTTGFAHIVSTCCAHSLQIAD